MNLLYICIFLILITAISVYFIFRFYHSNKSCHPKCYEHGKCIGLNNCKCDDNYYGQDCTSACSTVNNRGIWNTESSMCICTDPKFTGVDCGTLDCLNGGKEIDNNCKCLSPYTGDRCQINKNTCNSDKSCDESNSRCVYKKYQTDDGHTTDTTKVCESVIKINDMCASGEGDVIGACPDNSSCLYFGSDKSDGNIWKCNKSLSR